MRAGYGRGYYGEGQLAPEPPRRGIGWGKIAFVVGVGAVVWYMWPRSPKFTYPEGGRGDDDPRPPAPPISPPSGGPIAQIDPRDEAAHQRGYSSRQAYEDAVVESARQLQDVGTKVEFAPHLQHLAPRLLLP